MPDPRANPAVQVMLARQQLASEAEREFAVAATSDDVGRTFLDVTTIRHVLVLRDEGRLSVSEIERHLGLKPGVVERLGPSGVVTAMAG